MTDDIDALATTTDATVGELPNMSNAPDDALLVAEYLGKARNSTLGQLKAALGAITGFEKTAGDCTPGTTDAYTITFANGGKLDILIPIPLNGKDGYTPKKGVDYHDGKDGYTPKKGVDYDDGKDGFSPIVDFKEVTDGVEITITDKTGPHTAKLKNGADGVSPVFRTEEIEGGVRIILSDAHSYQHFDLYNGDSGDWSINSPALRGYIKGRTHSREVYGVDGEIIPEMTVSFGDVFNFAQVTGAIADGIAAKGKYTVTWNGTVYECTGKASDDGPYIGNGSLIAPDVLDIEDTGEPFCILMFGGVYYQVFKEAAAAEDATLKVVGEQVVIWHKLDSRYLDLEWMAAHKDSGTEIIPETTISAATTTSYSRNLLVNGAEYIITWNGEKYRRRCSGSAYGARLGNSSLWNSNDEDNGVPFLFLGIGTIRVIATEYPATFSVERINYEPLPYDYAPENYKIPTAIGTNENGRCTVPNSELFHAKNVLEHGAKVYGSVNYLTVEILAIDMDMDEYHHGFVYRNSKGDLYFTRCSNDENTKIDAMTPAVDREDIILRSPSGKRFRFTVDDTGALSAADVTK